MPKAVQPSVPQSGRSPLAATKPAQAVETTKALRRACSRHWGLQKGFPAFSMAGSGLQVDCKQCCRQSMDAQALLGCLMRTFDSCLYTRAASQNRWLSE